jgi:hypothetical protein
MAHKDDEMDAFEEDIAFLVNTLKDIFEADEVHYQVEAETETLYIRIQGINDFDEESIEEMAGEVLDELYLDFEQIILMPL